MILGMSDKKRNVEEASSEIERLDAQLLALLERRAEASARIGQLQPESLRGAMTSQPPPALAKTSLIDPRAVREILRAVSAACAPLVAPRDVAVSGVDGSGVFAAARARFGAGARLMTFNSVELALSEVRNNRATYAVVPYEMQPYGPVDETIRALVAFDVRIVGCFEQRENVALVNKSGTPDQVTTIYATRFLAENFPTVRVADVRVPRMALDIALEDSTAAALVSESFALEEGLQAVHTNVRDAGDDRVRYAVIANRPSSKTGADLTALVFSVNDSPGALHEVLRRFAERDINLTKIESRPTGGEEWVYLFFLEIVGHLTDRHVVTALDEVKRSTRFFKILGSYGRE
jgi:chorismate mutase / prephenate dehydratase